MLSNTTFEKYITSSMRLMSSFLNHFQHIVPSFANKAALLFTYSFKTWFNNNWSTYTLHLPIMRFHQVFAWLCCLSTLQLVTAFAIDQPLRKRSIQKGWALAQSSCPAGAKSCGDGSCCPSNLFCIEHANMEVAACCPASEELRTFWYIFGWHSKLDSPCRGDIESSPKCANSAWALWTGAHGNGLCCLENSQGVYRIEDRVAGTCVPKGQVPNGYTTAVLVSLPFFNYVFFVEKVSESLWHIQNTTQFKTWGKADTENRRQQVHPWLLPHQLCFRPPQHIIPDRLTLGHLEQLESLSSSTTWLEQSVMNIAKKTYWTQKPLEAMLSP